MGKRSYLGSVSALCIPVRRSMRLAIARLDQCAKPKRRRLTDQDVIADGWNVILQRIKTKWTSACDRVRNANNRTKLPCRGRRGGDKTAVCIHCRCPPRQVGRDTLTELDAYGHGGIRLGTARLRHLNLTRTEMGRKRRATATVSLDTLWVRQEARNFGVGRRLLSRVVREVGHKHDLRLYVCPYDNDDSTDADSSDEDDEQRGRKRRLRQHKGGFIDLERFYGSFGFKCNRSSGEFLVRPAGPHV
jgi:GNAT superfamily N-acetyltransferase